jgi:hypothetical protein
MLNVESNIIKDIKFIENVIELQNLKAPNLNLIIQFISQKRNEITHSSFL